MRPPSERVEVAGAGAASDYARRLLADLGVRVMSAPGPADRHPALAWAESGAMALTGRADALPRVPCGPRGDPPRRPPRVVGDCEAAGSAETARVLVDGGEARVAAARARPAYVGARAPGADTEALRRELQGGRL